MCWPAWPLGMRSMSSTSSSLNSAGCLDWTGGLIPNGAPITLQARVGHDIGPVASITALNIIRLDAGHDIIQSAIRQTSTSATCSAITAAGQIFDDLDNLASSAIIRSDGGPILAISAGGDIRCPISVQPVAPTTAAPSS